MNGRTAGAQQYRWIGCGIYTAAEASRLTGISASRIRRWVQGYTFIRKGRQRISPPVVSLEMPEPADRSLALTFRDVIEVMCVHGFLKAGVKWPLLRRAHERAAQILGLDHPFATRKFLTDGHSVLIKVGERSLLDLATDQLGLFQILRPYIKENDLDFADAFATRWWPMGKREPVVVDAERSFGQPIVTEGVPTILLYRAYLAESRATSIGIEAEAPSEIKRAKLPKEKTVRYVADWYSVSARSVRAAIEYESRLAA